jgi:hypothetical protein
LETGRFNEGSGKLSQDELGRDSLDVNVLMKELDETWNGRRTAHSYLNREKGAGSSFTKYNANPLRLQAPTA